MQTPWYLFAVLFCLVFRPASVVAQQDRTGVVQVSVEEAMGPVAGMTIRAAGRAAVTDAAGKARLTLPVGRHTLSFARIGYAPKQVDVSIVADSVVILTVTVDMAEMAAMLEDVKVSATRADRLASQTPIKVEVVDEMEVDENKLMAPSGITMLLNETPGLRVLSASPTLGTGAVRILGLPGQYTVMLADGLPLYGGTTSALGALDISPVDLQRVEIIKGAASSLYGGQALGGVINLVSKPATGKNEVLLNRRTMGVTDAATWLSRRLGSSTGVSLLASGTIQEPQDIDEDGWNDQSRARRWGVRPRFTAVDAKGRRVFLTAGYGYDQREGGGTVPNGSSFAEALTSRRADLGASASIPTRDSGMIAFRFALAGSDRERVFGPGPREDDATATGFVEVTRSINSSRGTTVLGSALQFDRFENSLNDRYDHRWLTPGVFATMERGVGPLTLSLSLRGDAHPEIGFQLTERVAVLAKPAEEWSVRVSAGTGYSAPTASIEETEAIGLRAVRPNASLDREQSFSSMVDLSGELLGAELLATGYISTVADAIQLAPVADGSNDGILRNATSGSNYGGVELAAVWRFVGGKFLGTYGYSRGTRPDPETGARRQAPLLPRHRVGGDLMFEKEGKYRSGIEGIWYGAQTLDDNPFRTRSKPYFYLMAIAMRQFGGLEVVANFENLLDVRQTRTDPLVRPSPFIGGRWTTDVWSPLEGFMANAAVRYRW